MTLTLTPMFSAALADHLSRLKLLGRAETTLYQRRGAVIRFARSLEGLCPFDVTAADLDAWQTVTLAGLSDTTRSCDVGHVSRFYRWAVGEGLLAADRGAMLDARLIRPRLPRRMPRPIGEGNLEQLVFAAPDAIRPWLVLAGWAGLRAGEVARAERGDVQDGGVMLVHGKGNRERLVPLSPFVLAELEAFGMPSRGPIFRRPSDGRQQSPQRISQLANAYMRSIGVRDTFHALRHRFATQLYAATNDLRLVQEILGHANLSTTAMYVGYCNAAAATGVAALPVPASVRHLSSVSVVTT